MAFDPDAYLAKKSAVNIQQAAPSRDSGFDPDAYLAKKAGRSPDQFSVKELGQDKGVIEEAATAKTEYPSFKFNPDNMKESAPAEQAGLEAIGNAISMGYLPQLQAAAEKFIMPDPNAEVDAKLKEQGFIIENDPSYVQLRDENLRRQQAQREQYPNEVMGGNLIGMGVTAPIGAGAAKAVGLGKNLSTAARFKDAAIAGAGYGASYNPGDTEGTVDPLQLEERGVNAAKGAAMGLVAQGGGEAIAKTGEAIKNAPKMAEKVSNLSAFKAIGAIGRDFKKALKNNAAEEVGETIQKLNIIQPGDSLEEIAKKAAIEKDKTGKAIGEIYKRTQNELTGPEKLAQMSVKNRKLLEVTELNGEKLAEASLAKIERNLKNNLAAPEIKNKVLGVLQGLQEKGKQIDLLDLQQMKSNLDKQINYDKALRDMPEVQKELKVVRDVMNKAIQNRVRVLGRVSVDKTLINQLKEANKTYGHLSKAESIASNRAKEIEGHRFFSLTETITGSAGASIGAMSGDTPEERVKNAIIGFAAGAAAKKADKFATPVVARTAKRLGVLLRQPSNFAKYGEPLIDAAKRSPQEFQAVVNQFSKDPEFKKLAQPQGAR